MRFRVDELRGSGGLSFQVELSSHGILTIREPERRSFCDYFLYDLWFLPTVRRTAVMFVGRESTVSPSGHVYTLTNIPKEP